MMETANFNIESLPVRIEYVSETMRDDWKCDQWRISLQSKAGFWSTDYFTGLGHRVKNKPKKPTIASVLHSLFMDAQAANDNFVDWCSNLGYSDDSIKAFTIYKSCLDTAVHLRKHFSPSERAAIQSIIEEM